MTDERGWPDDTVSAMLELSPQMRVWALVGYYIQCFSLLEETIDQSLASIMGTGIFPGFILGRNLTVSDKVNVLRTLADLVYAMPKRTDEIIEEAAMRNSLKKLLTHMKERNVIAHTAGMVSADGEGVLFSTIKASSQLRFESEEWTVSRFKTRTDEMMELCDDVEALASVAEARGFFAVARAKSPELAVDAYLELTREPFEAHPTT